MTRFHIQVCGSCGRAWFPDRLRCPRCGARAWHRVQAGEGIVAEETELRRGPEVETEPIRLGVVGLEAGPVIIARLGDAVRKGTRVSLESDANGAIWASPAPGAAPG